MKYLTKEWYYMARQGFFGRDYVKANEKANQFDEKLFQRLYKKVEKQYIQNSFLYRKTEEDDQKINEYFDKQLAKAKTEEEKLEIEKFRELYKIMSKEEMKLQKEYDKTFDEEKAKKSFAGWYNDHLIIVDTLPQTILDKVADKRVLALGYATKEVRSIVKEYAKGQAVKSDEVWEQAKASDEALERLLGLDTLSLVDSGILYAVRKVKNGLLLKFKDVEDIRVVNGVIISQEKPINKFVERVHFCPMTMMIGKEIEYIDDKFRFNMLLDNIDEYENRTTWEMVVEGDELYLE